MRNTNLSGKVQTVVGPISPDSLGPTMAHEHLLIDLTCLFLAPTEATEIFRANQPITLATLGWIRYNYFAHRENLVLLDEEAAVAELSHFKRAGGGAIVDVTPIGIGRDPLGLSRIARATGLNIIMGT